MAQRLEHVTTLIFARETLEKALQLLGDDIGVKVEILGGDLQLEGITKNQSFGLDERNRPAGEILRKIMLQANPDGKLVYIVKPRVPGGRGDAVYHHAQGGRKAWRQTAARIDHRKGQGEVNRGRL